jgi:deoxyribonuclease-4
MRIGIHTFTRGSLENAALKAHELGANAFQIFSSSPRMWRASVPDVIAIRKLAGVREKHDLHPMVIHASYLINLASCDETIRTKSIDAFRAELQRAVAIGAEHVVLHPGSCTGHTVELGIHTFANSLAEAARGFSTNGLKLLFENTAGSGNALGSKFEELRVMREYAGKLGVELEIGYCIDTCHCLAAGFNIANAAGLNQTVRLLDDILGLENIPVFHANDSKTPLGSRVDRHAHIGEGYIGKEGFRRILTHPKLLAKAFILETPIDNEGDDKRNVEMLKSLCRRSRTTTKKSS